jgi:hypothetical protein
MKKITAKEVLTWELRSDRLDPKPFAGLYPTRWLIRGELRQGKQKKSFYYFGKPNYHVAMQVARLAADNNGWIQFREFDRGGLIKSGLRNCPAAYMDMGCQEYANVLCQLYYFIGQRPDRWFNGWEVGGWRHRKQVIIRGHKIMTYDNLPEPWSSLTLAGGKKWAQNTKLAWS